MSPAWVVAALAGAFAFAVALAALGYRMRWRAAEARLQRVEGDRGALNAMLRGAPVGVFAFAGPRAGASPGLAHLLNLSPGESDFEQLCGRLADADARRLYLSAYDRTALDDAVAGDAGRLPQGAIYALPLDALANGDGPLRATAATDTAMAARDLHPHGIALLPGGRLAAVNHAYERTGGDWRRRTRIELFRTGPDRLHRAGTIAHPALCRANDLAAADADTLFVTRDHGACGTAGRWLEDLLGLERGQLLQVTLGGTPAVEVAAQGLSIPNGVAVASDGQVYVAETRRRAVSVFDVRGLQNGGRQAPRRIAMDGGPDNLSLGPDGRVLAALHPTLWRYALARYRWFGVETAATRLVGLAPETGQVTRLFDDPEGRLLAAATAVLQVPGALVASSAIDAALLVCR